MKKPIHIRIPEPCHEDWQQMTPTEKGKFCQVCTKEVMDFSYHSDDYIYRTLNNNENLCGRFHPKQLNRPIQALPKVKKGLKQRILAALIPLLSLVGWKSAAQEEIKPIRLENVDISGYKVQKQKAILGTTTTINGKPAQSLRIGRVAQQDSVKISGTITDVSGPLPGAHIVIKGSTKGTQSDFDGNFTLKASYGDVLEISYVGFVTKEYKVLSTQKELKIKLELDEMISGGIILGMVVTEEREENPALKPLYNMSRVFTEEEKSKFSKQKERIQNYFYFMKLKRQREREAKKLAKQAKKSKK